MVKYIEGQDGFELLEEFNLRGDEKTLQVILCKINNERQFLACYAKKVDGKMRFKKASNDAIEADLAAAGLDMSPENKKKTASLVMEQGNRHPDYLVRKWAASTKWLCDVKSNGDYEKFAKIQDEIEKLAKKLENAGRVPDYPPVGQEDMRNILGETKHHKKPDSTKKSKTKNSSESESEEKPTKRQKKAVSESDPAVPALPSKKARGRPASGKTVPPSPAKKRPAEPSIDEPESKKVQAEKKPSDFFGNLLDEVERAYENYTKKPVRLANAIPLCKLDEKLSLQGLLVGKDDDQPATFMVSVAIAMDPKRPVQNILDLKFELPTLESESLEDMKTYFDKLETLAKEMKEKINASVGSVGKEEDEFADIIHSDKKTIVEWKDCILSSSTNFQCFRQYAEKLAINKSLVGPYVVSAYGRLTGKFNEIEKPGSPDSF